MMQKESESCRQCINAFLTPINFAASPHGGKGSVLKESLHEWLASTLSAHVATIHGSWDDASRKGIKRRQSQEGLPILAMIDVKGFIVVDFTASRAANDQAIIPHLLENCKSYSRVVEFSCSRAP
jgi:hypothetical protein